MAIYAVNINERTNAGKALLHYLLSLGVVSQPSDEGLSGYEETLQAIKDVNAGKVKHYKNFDDFKKRMYAL